MGKHMAMMTMKMSIVHTLRDYDMRPVPGTEKEMDWDYRFTIVRPTKGHKVIITKADNQNQEIESWQYFSAVESVGSEWYTGSLNFGEIIINEFFGSP